MIIVSACLAGIKCRYDGKSKPCQKVIELVKQGKAIPVCPEQLGGLPTPRIPSEQKDKKVITKDGKNVTKNFKQGAETALQITKENNCNKAILKTKSAACGYGKIYDGTFSGKLINGNGVFAKLLEKNGITIQTENDI
jgi:uncharacterized protein YbbK (DUF523 family)